VICDLVNVRHHVVGYENRMQQLDQWAADAMHKLPAQS
jgi:hypothetical protein